jgi:signal transduction histidine kinase
MLGESLNWIKLLQSLYRQFSSQNGSLAPFSKIEKIVKQKLGLTDMVFALRHGMGLKTIDGKSPFSVSVQKAVIVHLSRTLKPWIYSREDKSRWRGFWPIIVGKDWVGCFGVGSKLSHLDLNDEEKNFLELLADRSSLYLEGSRLWKCLERADRQSSLDFRSAAMIHEIRGPLTALSTLVQLLPEKKGDELFMSSFQPLILRQINRLADMTETFNGFTNSDLRVTDLVEFSQIVNQVVGLMSSLFEIKRVRLKVKNHSDLFLKGNKQQMESLVFNLLQNALESVGFRGKVEVSTALLSRSSYGPGPWMELKVKDNGVGISKENLKKIFNPYFSTKSRGTGLGLAICQRVVENHRGSIKASSSKRNTIFQIFLPLDRKS